jgi:Protein of unknown function (DUF642)/PEP-CTERM motif
MRISALRVICFGLLASLAIDAKAGSLVVNGGFESPVVSPPFETFSVNSTAITGWTVISGIHDPGSGSVDLLHNASIPVHSGLQAVDLDGTGGAAVGGLSQNVSGLTPGSLYTLDFFYANNPFGTSSSALVTIGDLSVTITHSGSTIAAMNYSEGTYTFTATNSLLSFSSLDPAGDENGIILDDVSIVAASVPEPSSCVMLGLGLLAVVGLIRGRRWTTRIHGSRMLPPWPKGRRSMFRTFVRNGCRN